MIIHGDAYQVIKTLDNQSVDLIFTSPSPEQDVFDLARFFWHCRRVLKDTGSLWVQMGDYHDESGNLMGRPMYFEREMTTQMDNYWHLKNRLIWQRSEKHYMQEDYNRFLRDWEYLFWFTKNSKNYYFNNPHNQVLSSVIKTPYIEPRGNNFESGFPEKLIEVAIIRTCPLGGIVLDPFGGTGTTGLVAKRMGYDYIMIEKDEACYYGIKGRLNEV